MKLSEFKFKTDWQNTGMDKGCGNGKFAIAKKNGILYFLKKTNEPTLPTLGMPAEQRENVLAECKKYIDKQKKLKAAMESVGICPGGDIVIEEDWIPDEESGCFITVSRLAENIYSGMAFELGIEAYRQIFLSAAENVALLKKAGIIHGDIKPKNFLIAKRNDDRYTVKVVDFDSSYFADDLPENVVGTVQYESPESIAYNNGEKKFPDGSPLVSFATDIYSLALTLYVIYTGELPGTDSSVKSNLISEIAAGAKLVYNSDFASKKIICGGNYTYASLLNWMLQINPKDRPSIETVLSILRGEDVEIPAQYLYSMEECIQYDDLWTEHTACGAISLKPQETLKAKGIRHILRIRFKAYEKEKLCYEIKSKDRNNPTIVDFDYLLNNDLVQCSYSFCEAYDGDGFDFLSAEDLKKNGYVRIVRLSAASENSHSVYLIGKRNGTSVTESSASIRYDSSLAIRKPRAKRAETAYVKYLDPLWEEDEKSYFFVESHPADYIAEVSRIMKDGVKLYACKHTKGIISYQNIKELFMLGLIKRR